MNYKNLLSFFLLALSINTTAQITAKSINTQEEKSPKESIIKYDSLSNFDRFLFSDDNDIEQLIGQSIYIPPLIDTLLQKNSFLNTTLRIESIYTREKFQLESEKYFDISKFIKSVDNHLLKNEYYDKLDSIKVISLIKAQNKKIIFYDIDNNMVLRSLPNRGLDLDESIISFLFNQLSDDQPGLVKLKSNDGNILFITVSSFSKLNVFIEGFVIKAKEKIGNNYIFDNPWKGTYTGSHNPKKFYTINASSGDYIDIKPASNWKLVDIQILNNPKSSITDEEDAYNNNKDTFNISYIDNIYRLYAIMQNPNGLQILVPAINELDYHYSLSKFFFTEKEYLASNKSYKKQQEAMTTIIQNTHPAEYERITKGKDFKQSMITKYGEKFGNAISSNKIVIGMTQEMCILSWGNPQGITKTTTDKQITTILKYNNSAKVYLVNNKVTKIIE